MSMKKNMNSRLHVVLGNGDESNMYLPGYKYMIDGHVFTVKERMVEDNSEMRLVIGDDGTEQVVSVASIVEDHDPQRNGGRMVKVLKIPN